MGKLITVGSRLCRVKTSRREIHSYFSAHSDQCGDFLHHREAASRTAFQHGQYQKHVFPLETPAPFLHCFEVQHGLSSVDFILTLQLWGPSVSFSMLLLCNCHVLSSSVPLGPLSSAPPSPLCNGKKPLGYSSGNLTPEGDLLLVILIVLSMYTVLSAMLILKFVASPGGQTTWRRAAIGPGK